MKISARWNKKYRGQYGDWFVSVAVAEINAHFLIFCIEISKVI